MSVEDRWARHAEPEHSSPNRAPVRSRGEGERHDPDISICTLYQWVCWSCRDVFDPNVPGAYGDGDTWGEVSQAVAEHKRQVHGVLS